MSSPVLFATPDEPTPTDNGEAVQTESRPTGTQSLYRKFRPQTFDEHELVGQDAIVRTLRNAVRADRVAHAYLFSGPRGTGKTTTARLLAKAVNCTDPDPEVRPCNRCQACLAIAEGSAVDVIEIDAASNRGIDDIRELRERVKFAPAQLRTKFYIIDEAHQITGAAANAFLKTLEEPPAHTRFVLATTDPEQILPTIVSRCQRFEFKRISVEASRQRLAHVAAQEGLQVEPQALDLISRQAGGSLRDALGLLDQTTAFRRQAGEVDVKPITVADVRDLLGLSRDEMIVQLAAALGRRDAGEALGILRRATDEGADPRQINRQLVQFLRSIMHFLADQRSTDDPEVARVASFFSLGEVMTEAERFSEIDFKVRHNLIPQLPLEIGIVGSVLRGDQRSASSPATETAPPRQPVHAANQAPVAATAPPPAPPAAPPVSLSDRVRSTLPPVVKPPAASQPAASAAGEKAPANAAGNQTTISIEQLRSSWEQIRANLKARSRRIDALLMSVDPSSVQGDLITLTSAYPFHRNKLNEPEVQAVVEEVISDILGARMRVSTLLHGEAPVAGVSGATTQQPSSTEQANATSGQHNASNELPPDGKRIIDTVKNIFDAEEIES